MKEIIKDQSGRDIICHRNGILAIARYPDMDEATKEYIIDLYYEATGTDRHKIRNFLDFKDENHVFCS